MNRTSRLRTWRHPGITTVAILIACGGLLFSPAVATADTLVIATSGTSGNEFDVPYFDTSLGTLTSINIWVEWTASNALTFDPGDPSVGHSIFPTASSPSGISFLMPGTTGGPPILLPEGLHTHSMGMGGGGVTVTDASLLVEFQLGSPVHFFVDTGSILTRDPTGHDHRLLAYSDIQALTTFEYTQVPEPGTLALAGCGVVGLVLAGRRARPQRPRTPV